MGQMIDLTAADGFAFGAYHAEAEGTRKGGLILIQEIFGVTDHIKEQADGFAKDGYEVIAPSMYDRQDKGWTSGYTEADVADAIAKAGANSMENACMDVEAARDFLKERGPVFMTGYCYGGSVTWVAACRVDGLAAAASYYGRLVIDHVDENPKCPTIFHFGELDPTIPMDAVRRIEAAHPECPSYVYAGADHGFQSDRPQHYDEAAATLARQRTLDHFAAHA